MKFFLQLSSFKTMPKFWMILNFYAQSWLSCQGWHIHFKFDDNCFKKSWHLYFLGLTTVTVFDLGFWSLLLFTNFFIHKIWYFNYSWCGWKIVEKISFWKFNGKKCLTEKLTLINNYSLSAWLFHVITTDAIKRINSRIISLPKIFL